MSDPKRNATARAAKFLKKHPPPRRNATGHMLNSDGSPRDTKNGSTGATVVRPPR